MPRATNVKITKTYKTVQVVTVWWENNDFGDEPKVNIKKEMKDWDYVTTEVDGAQPRIDIMIPKSLKGNEPEEWLLKELQGVYDGMAQATAPALLILIYSGHGMAAMDQGFLKNIEEKRLKYKPRKELTVSLPSTAKGEDPRALFWIDRAFTGACLDWSWVRSQLKPTKKLTHWVIYDCCFSGNAVFAGTKDKRKEPLFPANGAVVHSFCAVGAALKKKGKLADLTARAGAHSFSKMVLEALRVLRSKQQPCDISDVWRTVSQLKDFEHLVGTNDILRDMTDAELVEWVFRDETVKDKLLASAARTQLRTPFYNIGGLPAPTWMDKANVHIGSPDGFKITGIGFQAIPSPGT